MSDMTERKVVIEVNDVTIKQWQMISSQALSRICVAEVDYKTSGI